MNRYVVTRDSDGMCINAIVLDDPSAYDPGPGLRVHPRAGDEWIGWSFVDGRWRPPRPFPSWSWVDGAWAAPVPMPDDDAPHEWDEDAQAWIVAE